jgi:Rieske Fe-S protein
MPPDDRRKFLATCAIGSGACLAASVPLVRLVLDPAGKQTVTTPRAPIDIGPADRFGATPTKVDIVAPIVRDAWTAARDVVLGAAFIRRVPASELAKLEPTGIVKVGDDGLDARSAVCPHLGCTVSFDGVQKNYLCPCHDSRFELSGAKQGGPSERGMDQLPLQLVNGRLLLTWERYKTGKTTKEPV